MASIGVRGRIFRKGEFPENLCPKRESNKESQERESKKESIIIQ